MMNTNYHRPPEAWRSLSTSEPGRGTPERDTRRLALAEAVVEKIDAKLARIGNTPKALAERFDAHSTEIRSFLSG